MFCILWFSGVSAQSFIHAFTLTHSVFNVQIATPQVRNSFKNKDHDFNLSLQWNLPPSPQWDTLWEQNKFQLRRGVCQCRSPRHQGVSPPSNVTSPCLKNEKYSGVSLLRLVANWLEARIPGGKMTRCGLPIHGRLKMKCMYVAGTMT